MQHRGLQVDAQLVVHRGGEHGHDHRGQQAVERHEGERPLRDLSLGTRVLHDQQDHRRGSRHRDGGSKACHERSEPHRVEDGEDEDEGEEALHHPRGRQRPVAPEPADVDAPAQLEEHQSQADVDEDARFPEQRADVHRRGHGRDREPHQHVADDARQAQLARRLPAEHAGDEQRAEQEREIQFHRQGRQEPGFHEQVSPDVVSGLMVLRVEDAAAGLWLE